MQLRLKLFSILAMCLLGAPVAAQDKYDRFFGQYAAAIHIAKTCNGMTVADRQSAAEIAKAQDGLRKQKVIRLSYYGKTDVIQELGQMALKDRQIDPNNKSQVCGFGRKIAGKDDKIGRFLSNK